MLFTQLVAVTSAFATVALGFPSTPLLARIVSEQDIDHSYDYIVVGGGTAGLTVADRLTENPRKTVLVIETGQLDEREDAFLVPHFIGTAPPKYFYNLTSIPQPAGGNRTFPVLAGCVVGGGSAVNGMFFDRGSAGDYNLWRDLGNPGWGWDDLLPYFKKSETFHPPDSTTVEDLGVTYNMSVRGTSGPIHASYPPFLYPAVKNFQAAFKEFGTHVPYDGASGDALGAFWTPNSLDPAEMIRSYARIAHYDLIASRPNLHLLTGHSVTKVLFRGVIATGVEFTPFGGSRRMTVNAKSEVILAAGAPHTPQILQLSGVGPEALLNKLHIPIVVNLPGVGQNFQDHPASFTDGIFVNDLNPSPSNNTNATWIEEQSILYETEKKGFYTTSSGNAAAFIPLHELTNRTDELVDAYASQEPKLQFPAGTDSTIIAGWRAQRDALLASIRAGVVAVSEYANGPTAAMAIVLEKPLSRGSITINSTDPLANPVIDYGFYKNPVDVEIQVEAIRAWRKVLSMPSWQALGAQPTNPANNITTNEQLREWVIQVSTPTTSHPSGTASMLPKNLGGVVGPDLRVYGVSKLSVVDASIIPMIPATHIQSTVYAIAEKVSTLIRLQVDSILIIHF
ncbi:GMC oxidoreductase [Serendipita vermifera MAFF 305830]|uniref:GMC oxidoreductase n=1 Tax=Serendipita vermifera MAFF 305830 TaxID=933852 RepID=A0A0C3AKL1_SERVB|nr:GMC oxidoreductase [Serendipita vermifera MAFF 305830]